MLFQRLLCKVKLKSLKKYTCPYILRVRQFLGRHCCYIHIGKHFMTTVFHGQTSLLVRITWHTILWFTVYWQEQILSLLWQELFYLLTGVSVLQQRSTGISWQAFWRYTLDVDFIKDKKKDKKEERKRMKSTKLTKSVLLAWISIKVRWHYFSFFRHL